MVLKATIELRSVGGFPCVVSKMPVEIVKGSEVWLRAYLKRPDDSPMVITYHHVSLVMRKADKSLLEIQGVPFDNVQGIVDFEICSADSLALMISKQPQAVELRLVAAGNDSVKCSIPIQNAVTIKLPLMR